MKKTLFVSLILSLLAAGICSAAPTMQPGSPSTVYVAGNTYSAFNTSIAPNIRTSVVAIRVRPGPVGDTYTGYALSAYVEAAFTAAPNTYTAGAGTMTALPEEWLYVVLRKVGRTVYLNLRNAVDRTLGASGWLEYYEIQLP